MDYETSDLSNVFRKLKTAFPVSEKKLDKKLKTLKEWFEYSCNYTDY